MSILVMKMLLLSLAITLQTPLEIVEGMLIESDSQDKIVTFIPKEGVIQHVAFDATSLAFDSEGKKLSGFNDIALRRGVSIKLVLSQSPRIVKELRMIPQQASP